MGRHRLPASWAIGVFAFLCWPVALLVAYFISAPLPYTNPNLPARALLTEAQRANPASDPPPAQDNGPQIVSRIIAPK